MKVYVVTDLEGVSGIGSYDVHDHHSPIDAARRERWLELRVGEVNAAIDGAVSAGATEFVVIVGQHAMAGDRRGHLRHTYSRRRLAWVRLNGNEIGEAGLIAGIAGEVGVPVVCLTGNDAAVAEFSRMAPNAEGVAVKNSLSQRACLSLPVEVGRERMRMGVARGLERRQEIPPVQFTPPLTLRARYHLRDGWRAPARWLRSGFRLGLRGGRDLYLQGEHLSPLWDRFIGLQG